MVRAPAGKPVGLSNERCACKNQIGMGCQPRQDATELVLERLTGQSKPFIQTADMEFGTLTEPEARSAYEWRTGNEVREIGWVESHIDNLGCSPDGLVGDSGLVEIKCPASHTHVNTLLNETIDKKYILQMQAQMLVCGRQWCDFVSFDPRLPAELQYWSKRVHRLPEEEMNTLEQDCTEFVAYVDDLEKRLREKMQ